jgi:hypothetical protein
MIKHGRNPCLVNPNEGAEPELFNVRAILIVEGSTCKAINSIFLHEENHIEVKYMIKQTPLTFLFSLGQYDLKRNLTQHNFFIPKC